MNLYNEIETNAAQWMQNLMDAGQIPQGKIDGRPIQQLRAADFNGVKQFHTFAGIGGWALALKIAGWPEDREVWTGSCPCQPYSSAGKQKGNSDERDLWPAFFALIKERRPESIFGEQVASAIRHGWLDRVCADLEGIGYTVGSAVLGAHSVGANHIRQRLYWGACLDGSGTRGLGDSIGDDVGWERRGTLGAQAEGDSCGVEDGTRGVMSGSASDVSLLAQDAGGLRRRGRDVRRYESDKGKSQAKGKASGLGIGGGFCHGQSDGRGQGGADAGRRGEGAIDETFNRSPDAGGLAFGVGHSSSTERGEGGDAPPRRERGITSVFRIWSVE